MKKVVGRNVTKIDAFKLVRGEPVFTDDFRREGMLYAKVLRSPHAHARIVSIDTSRAEALEGVKAVLTADDVPETFYGVSPARYDEQVLAADRVRYVGDEIAAVAAVAADPQSADDYVETGPHMMIVVPKEMLKGITSDPSQGGPYVMWGETPFAHIMIPVALEGKGVVTKGM